MSRGTVEINQNDAILILKWVDQDIYDVEIDVNTQGDVDSANKLAAEALYQLLKNPKYQMRMERLMGDVDIDKNGEPELEEVEDEEVADTS